MAKGGGGVQRLYPPARPVHKWRMQTQMSPDIGYDAAVAALQWMLEMGVVEPVGDTPVCAYDLPSAQAEPPRPPVQDEPQQIKPQRQTQMAPPMAPVVVADAIDTVAEARAAAARAATLADLHQAVMAYPHCALKQGARNTVFSDGNEKARVMIVGEAPGRDEDLQGKPFVGKSGQLLDRMLAAVGLSRGSPDPAAAVYITNVMPWRPPGNRDPEPAEIAQMVPFLARHVDLIDPDVILLLGNTACAAALNARGITRLRGTWAEAFGRPALPTLHPASLLHNPANKRLVWADLLSLRARLNEAPAP